MAKKKPKAAGTSGGTSKGTSKGPSKGTSGSTSKGRPAKRAVAAAAAQPFSEALRAGEGFTVVGAETRATPAFEGGKKDAEKLMPQLAERLSDLQERLYAEAHEGGRRSVLLVVQGMDTSGKGGIMRHVVGALDPEGVKVTAFKAPTAEERLHPFLWRIRNALPAPGKVGVFDRSHYEDVLVARVHDLVPRGTWSRRYAQINAFERKVVASGTTIVKVMLDLSPGEQKERLLARLDRADKRWKYNPGDVTERVLWPSYMEAYQEAVQRCSTPNAPWFVVPADRKWYARLAVMNLLLEQLSVMDPQWPAVHYDVEAEKERLIAT